MKPLTKLALAGLTVALCACSALESDKVDYKSAAKAKAPSLDIPPDLTQLTRDTRYTSPGGVVSANGYQASNAAPQPVTMAPASISDVRVERAGSQRWLVVDRAPEQLWDPIKEFWQENGFLLAQEQANLGIMETDWAENRAKIPQDFLRKMIGKVIDALYSTPERDKFRTRIERTANGGSEIYISHRGMVEVNSVDNKDQTVWQVRPTDPELEAEFLSRLMLKLGLGNEQSKALLANATVRQSARIVTSDGQPTLEISEGFDRAWRRVGLSLDRTGFTVEDRDRSQGSYFVRFVEPVKADQPEPGFFSRLFGASKPKAPGPQKYRITVRGDAEKTTVRVLNTAGEPVSADSANLIVKVLADDLK